MRQFQCRSCGHTFQVARCNGQKGYSLSCPQCGGPVNRVTGAGRWNQGAQQSVPAGFAGRGSGGGQWGRGCCRRGA